MISAEEFYTKRDARTAEWLDPTGLHAVSLGISIDEVEAQTFAGQLAFLLLVNMSARWCQRITLVAPDVPLHTALYCWGTNQLVDNALALAQRADPYGIFQDQCEPVAASVRIHLGRHPTLPISCIRGRGWLSELRHSDDMKLKDDDSINPLGPALAACMGASYMLRHALRHDDVCETAILSLWNLHHGGAVIDGPDLQKSDIGRVLLIGAGAVGASIAYLLPLLNLNFSDLCIINPDQVDYSNLNRVPLFFIEHIGVPKSEVVHNYLCAASVPSRYIGKWFNDVIGPELSLQNFDVVIPVANEHGVRAAVQANYPPVMIHGSTGSQWDAYAGRHIPLVDDCLVCRFPQPAAAPRCAQGVLKEQESAGAAPLTGALPFLSLAAGVLALADLVKLVIPGDPPNANTTILSFKSANLRPMIFDRVPRANCGGCPDPVVWQKLNGSSRHAPSSGAG